MSISWNWKDKIGELKVRRELLEGCENFTVSIYEGNADLIFIYEYVENEIDMYSLFTFYCDFEHFKRCEKNHLNEWLSITFYDCNKKLCKYAREFFKLGIVVSFDPNYKEVERR